MVDLINQLPDECLECIFSFLPIEERLKVEGVCKRWRNIGKKGWPDTKKMHFGQFKSNVMNHLILKRCGRFLTDLHIPISPGNNCRYLSMVIKFCRLEQLERIYIAPGWTFGDEETALEFFYLREILDKAQNLVDITMDGVFEINVIHYISLENPTTLRKLEIINSGELPVSFNPDRFPNLQYLCLVDIKIDQSDMRRIEESLKSLEKLKFRDCNIPRGLIERIQSFTNLRILVLENDVCDIRNKDIQEIASNCVKLHQMTLINSEIFRDTSSLTSECFRYLGNMPSLRDLSLANFNNVNDLDVVHLMNLWLLNIKSCGGIPINDGLIQLITKSSNLECLKLSHIRDLDITFVHDVQQIFQRGLRQKHLDFRASIYYSDELVSRMFPIVIDKPLLSLEVELLEDNN